MVSRIAHALSPKETGEHGAVLLTVERPGKVEASLVPFSPVRYEIIPVDVSAAKDRFELSNKITSELLIQGGRMIAGLEKVRYLVCDIRLYGNHPGTGELEKWTAGIQDDHRELETGTIILPRKVINETAPAIGDLSILASQNTPAGIIAETILALQNGNSTPFLQNLRDQWKNEHEKLMMSATYQPLLKPGSATETETNDADGYILAECTRLLGEFMKQQAK